jgi:hypothetical protein
MGAGVGPERYPISNLEDVMSSLKYAIVENEINPTSAGEESRGEKSGLRLVSHGSEGARTPITRRVEAVLDFEFAQGHMPA